MYIVLQHIQRAQKEQANSNKIKPPLYLNEDELAHIILTAKHTQFTFQNY